MAQTIKFRRGAISSVINAGVQIGELLIGTGSLGTLDGPVLFTAVNNGIGTSTPVSKIFKAATAPSVSSHSTLTGLPFYAEDERILYRLNSAGNENLDLTGNIANRIITGSLTITTNLNVLQNVTASNLTTIDAKFTSASGSFSGSFHGDGSDLTGLVTRLYLSASADNLNQNSSTEIDLKTETFTISGSYSQGLYSNLTSNTLNLSLAQSILTSASPTFVGATFTGNVTASSLSASNLVQANTIKVNSPTLATGYTDGALNVAGGVGIGGNLFVSGAVIFYGDLTLYGSGSHLVITSSEVVIKDNILRLNGYAPYLRYAGVEVIDSGSEVTASFLWDGQNDYWLTINSNGQSSKLVGTTFNTFGSEISLTTNTIPKATANNTIGDSLLTENGTTLSYTGTGGLSVSSITASIVSASTSVITGDISSSTITATTSITTPNVYASYVSASTAIITDRLYSVSSITSSIISASTALIAGQITSSALTANTFIFANPSQALQSIAMTDMSGSYLTDLYLAWNSNSNVFFATSLIDGGTF